MCSRLPADHLALDDEGIQAFGGRVHRRGQAGGSAPHDHDVELRAPQAGGEAEALSDLDV